MYSSYIWVKHVRCPGCNKLQSFSGPHGLRMKYDPSTNYKLLLACSSDCAQKFCKKNPDDKFMPVDGEQDVIITNKGPIPYRKITQTGEQYATTKRTSKAKASE